MADQRSYLQQGMDLMSKEFSTPPAARDTTHGNRGPTNQHGDVDRNLKDQANSNPLDFTGTMSTIAKTLNKPK